MAHVIDSLVERIMELDRFIEVSNRETTALVEKQKNDNTRRMTDCHVRLLRSFLDTRRERRQIEDIPPVELDLLLAQFFLGVRKAAPADTEEFDGNSRQYEPGTLLAMQGSFHRYLCDKGYEVNVKADSHFKHSRDVLKAKMKELKQLGKGNKPHAAEPFTPEELQAFVERNLLGAANPQAIINTMWLNMTLHFGLRGRQEHTSMLWGDLQFSTDAKGQEFVEFNERATKTRQGASRDSRPFHPKMYATGSTLCPVYIYKEYTRRRPATCHEPDSRVYLQPLQSICYSDDVWFKNQPMGKNAIGNIAKSMAEGANLSNGNKTNHSGRKTAIQTLLHANVPPTNVVQLTGHKNIQSLNSYANMSLDQQRDVSHVLSSKMPDNATGITSHMCSGQLLKSVGLDDDMIVELLDEGSFIDTHNDVQSACQPSLNKTQTSILNSDPMPFSFLNGCTINGNIELHVHNYAEATAPPAKRFKSIQDVEQ